MAWPFIKYTAGSRTIMLLFGEKFLGKDFCRKMKIVVDKSDMLIYYC